MLGGVLCDESRQLLEQFLNRESSNQMQKKLVREWLASS